MSNIDTEFDVFISYSHKDIPFVRDTLTPKLKSWGKRVCVDYESFLPGQRLPEAIHRALSRSRQVIFVCTKSFIESEWCRNELVTVRSQDPASVRAKAVPVVLEQGTVPDLLQDIIWCNLITDINDSSEWEKLRQALSLYATSQPLPGSQLEAGAQSTPRRFESKVGATSREETHGIQPIARATDRVQERAEYRVIIVDGNAAVRNICSNVLHKSGFTVDTASNLQEALIRFQAKTYHVALIEVILSDDIANMDGLVLMDRVGELDEGTRVICLSGQSNTAIVRDVFVKHGAFDYLSKSSVRETADIVSCVNKACKACNLKLFGSRSSLLSVFAGDEIVPIWEDKALQALRPKSGYDQVCRLFWKLFESFLPIKVANDGKSIAQIDNSRGVVSGECWSKGTGTGISFTVWNSDHALEDGSIDESYSQQRQGILKQVAVGNLVGHIVELDYVSQMRLFNSI